MRSGTWNGPITTDNVRVTVNGVVRPVRNVTIQSGMRDGHPHADQGSWCVEASIDWVAPPLVFAGAPHLFGSGSEWMPRADDTVVIETGDGALGKWWVQHRGVIDDSSGSFADGTAKSTTIDKIDDLSGRVQFGALMSKMSPLATGFDFRWIMLGSCWMVDRMFRNPQTPGVGWYATPMTTWQTVASATNIGSTWPEVGSLRVSQRSPTVTGIPWGWRDTPYGLAPQGLYTETLFTSAISECILSVAVLPGGSGGLARYHAQDSAGMGPFIRVDTDAGVIEYGLTTTGTITFTLPIGSATRAALFFRRDGSSAQTLILRTDDGREVTQSTTAGAFPTGFTMDRIFVNTNDRGVCGWWMVEGAKTAAQRWNVLNETPTARIRRGADVRWRASRDMPFTMASEWLQQQVDAECAMMWLDEDGVMQWAGRGAIETDTVAHTITSVRDVDDVQWQQRRSSLARGVWVNYDEAAIDMGISGKRIKTCWKSDSIDVGRSEIVTEEITVPDNQDWISVSTDSLLGFNTTTPTEHGEETRHTGTQYVDLPGTDSEGWALAFTVGYVRRGLRGYTVTVEGWSTLGSSRRIVTRFPSASATPGVMSAWNGRDGLRLRGRAIITWTEKETSALGGTIGPARYTHDVDWRVQDHVWDAVTELRSFLADAVKDAKPRITGLTIAHDPRHQVGDKLRIQDTAVTGLDFDMLIQQRTVNVDDMTETIEGRVTNVRSTEAPGYRPAPGGHTALTPATNWNRTKDID